MSGIIHFRETIRLRLTYLFIASYHDVSTLPLLQCLVQLFLISLSISLMLLHRDLVCLQCTCSWASFRQWVQVISVHSIGGVQSHVQRHQLTTTSQQWGTMPRVSGTVECSQVPVDLKYLFPVSRSSKRWLLLLEKYQSMTNGNLVWARKKSLQELHPWACPKMTFGGQRLESYLLCFGFAQIKSGRCLLAN